MSSPVIKLYTGFANKEVTQVFGHVFKDQSQPRENPTKNPFKNAYEMFKRYRVSADKHVEVVLHMYGKNFHTRTNEKGYFEFKVQTNPNGNLVVGYEVHLSENPEIMSRGKLFLANPPEIIVSDIDDTVLVSHATKLRKKLYLLLTKNHETRKAFKGIRGFYEELCGHKETNMFFYVSSSEWNLYDFLKSFMAFNDLPNGVFLLQDIKLGIFDLFRTGGGSHMHKLEKIKLLIESYPDSKFILVGDSGQKDPIIYRTAALEYPDQIKRIYIRDVRSSRRERVEGIAKELAAKNIEMEIFTDE